MNEQTILIGSSLDAHAKPIQGTGIVLDKNSATARLLLAQPTVIIANPITKEYGATLQFQDEKGNITYKGLGIIPADSIGPPEHIHPNYDETFTVVEGKFEFLLNKKPTLISAGETIIVTKGTKHTFKPVSQGDICSFILEANPPGKLNDVIRTIWGLAIEGKTNKKGQPNEFLQGIAIGNELKEDTLFTVPPPFVQKLMFKLFGKKATKKGYKGIYEKYSQDDFWKSKVLQIES